MNTRFDGDAVDMRPSAMSLPSTPSRGPQSPTAKHAPLVSWRATYPVFIAVALVTAGGAFINNYTLLRCARDDSHPGGGECTLARGSVAFSYDERFFVRDLERAAVLSGESPDPNRALDFGGTRVYLYASGQSFRIIDNDRWSAADRDAVAARVNGFVADSSIPALEVVFDDRLLGFGKSLGMGILVGAGWLGFRYLRRRPYAR